VSDTDDTCPRCGAQPRPDPCACRVQTLVGVIPPPEPHDVVHLAEDGVVQGSIDGAHHLADGGTVVPAAASVLLGRPVGRGADITVRPGVLGQHFAPFTLGTGTKEDGDLIFAAPEVKDRHPTSRLLCSLPSWFHEPVLLPSVLPDLARTLSADEEGYVLVGPPPERETVAKVRRERGPDSLDSFLTLVASEVARLRWELERVKDRLP